MNHRPLVRAGVLALVWCVLGLAGPALAEGTVHTSAESVVPLAPGSPVPAAGIQTVAGDALALSDLVRDSGALLVFYRGGW